jgi:Uma2 family endonuclease
MPRAQRASTPFAEYLAMDDASQRRQLMAYRKLPGLRAYWIVSQDEQRVELHSRAVGADWEVVVYSAGDAIPAAALGGEPVAIERLYDGTDLA